MDLKEILAISGQPGLYKFVAQSSNGIIVEALADGRRSNIPSTARVSSMGEIAIFTEGEDMPIGKAFQGIYAAAEGRQALNPKTSDDKAMKSFFGKALPEYDKERVRISDMKKVISWYNILLDKGMITQEEEKAEE